MKRRLISCRLLGLAFVLSVTIYALSGVCSAQNAPVSALTAIQIPGNPVTSSDISWTDPGTARYYFADRSNFGVDIIDAVNDVWVGRVAGMAGALTSGGGTSTTNGPGPNGVVVTPLKRLWAGDGNATVQVADVDPASPTYQTILNSVSTALPVCDGGTTTTHYCGRADEIDYDPVDHIILIANPSPLSVLSPHGAVDPYATLINANPPYNVLGHITFVGAGGLEQPRWDAQTGRFLITVPGSMVGTTIVTPASIQIINPITVLSEKTYPIDCQAIAGVTSVSATGIVLTADQHILASACGFPVILTLDPNTTKINVINVIRQVGGGDQVWYNPGDGRFYVTGADMTTNPAGVQSLGVINAETSQWLQNVPDVRGKNPAALPANSHIFTIVQITAAIAAGTATDNSICFTSFNIKGMGCVAVFTHSFYRYDFFAPGTTTAAASFFFNGIVRDFSPASVPINGFTGFVAPSPASLVPCNLTSNSSGELDCLGEFTNGGTFQFIFNYGGYPRQPGAFTGSGFLAPDRRVPGLGYVPLLNGQITVIQP